MGQVFHGLHLLLCGKVLRLVLKRCKLCHPQVLSEWEVVQDQVIRASPIALLNTAHMNAGAHVACKMVIHRNQAECGDAMRLHKSKSSCLMALKGASL